MRIQVLFGAALCAVGWVGACGGAVTVGNTAGSTGTTGSGGGSTTGPTTGVTTGVGTSSSTTGGGPVVCAGLEHIACLGAYPSCVPVYDDKCCPSCDPTGGCANCVEILFHHCVEKDKACTAAGPVCGQTPDWACSGGKASCAIDPGGSQTPCASVAGCIPAYCPTNVVCKTDPVCHPATAGSCVASCETIPPPCPGGTIPEGDGFCYTGSCIPQSLCVFDL